MTKFKVGWCKTYYMSGELEVRAETEREARLKVEMLNEDERRELKSGNLEWHSGHRSFMTHVIGEIKK